jgi:putative SOS response-associated peptidase YedK
MPEVLPVDAWDEWLRPEQLPPRRLRELLVPAPDDLLRAYPVSTAVNKAGNDGPELLVPVSLLEPSLFVTS